MEEPMAFFHNVSVRTSGKALLESIDLTIGRKESLAILGPNGSGKTTLVKLISGERRSWTGSEDSECILFGRERWNLFELRHKLGLVSMDMQNCFRRDVRAGNVIMSGFFESMDVYRNHEVKEPMRERCREVVGLLGVSDLLEREYGTLSLGEARRFLIARALVNSPETLILDEPMTGLDIVAKESLLHMMQDLMEKGIAIVLITHDLEEIPGGMDRVVMMKHGRIFKDGPKRDVLTSRNLSDLFDRNVSVTWSSNGPSMTLMR